MMVNILTIFILFKLDKTLSNYPWLFSSMPQINKLRIKPPPFFPDKLTDLVKDSYLSQSDYSKLTKDIEISYFQPNTVSPSSNHLLLVAHIPKYVFYARVDGKLELKKIP